jgi:aspartyl-tRNA(Asn)/glutamyl-tRNA(Gln) amidotransferase subunit A
MNVGTSGAASEALAHHLKVIERSNPQLNALLTITADVARDAAAAADNTGGSSTDSSPLHGVPVVVKDCLPVAGVRSTFGNRAYKHRIADFDAEVVKRLKTAGAVIVGMSNLSEFCYGVTTINEYFGPCRNPWNLERIPGGSSGGSAAAVAAGMCRIAFGTDTGGSVRIPAALCGVAGLRPTVGRVPNTGGLGLTTNFDAAGPLAYDVADVAAGYMAIAGYDADDPNSVNRPVEDPLTTLGAGIAGMRIGIPKTFFFDNLAEDVAACVEKATKVFESCGATLVDIDLPGASDANMAVMTIVAAEALEVHLPQIESAPESISAGLLRRLKSGEKVDGVRFAASRRRLQKWQVTLRAAFEDVNLILTPTTPCTAPPISPDADTLESLRLLTSLTYGIGATGMPSLSVPCGFDRDHLPVGLQLASPWWQEASLLRAGAALQSRTEFHKARPKIAAAV